jgi:hypothetical protein
MTIGERLFLLVRYTWTTPNRCYSYSILYCYRTRIIELYGETENTIPLQLSDTHRTIYYQSKAQDALQCPPQQ